MKSVKIGNQEWMAENLAVDDGGEGVHYNPENKQYYYTWDAAMRVAKTIPGWHLPSAEEWNAAAEACGATVADNDYKDDLYMRNYEGTKKLYNTLMVLPVGLYGDGIFGQVGSISYFWSAFGSSSTEARFRFFVTSDALCQEDALKDRGLSVRLVKD